MSDILKFSVNIADAEPPAQLPPGQYRAMCVGVQSMISKSSGNPMIALTFEINKSEFPVDFESNEDSLKFTLYRTTRSTGRDPFAMKQLCMALGVPMSYQIDTNDFMMKECRVQISMGKDLEGNPQAQIDKVLSL
jgi:hypothetical protein